jgi:hypothetical protein
MREIPSVSAHASLERPRSSSGRRGVKLVVAAETQVDLRVLDNVPPLNQTEYLRQQFDGSDPVT